ncbi:MAG: hypothetical protein E6Q27_02430 [Aeromicrobium sp.]|nr:MAG: hypothetical protein E6Q27_02430 [Aeromicrobium sp.]
MPTRRTILIGTLAFGAGAVVLSQKADEVVGALGVDPSPQTRESDTARVNQALAESQTLLAAATSFAAPHAVDLLTAQIRGLGGSPTTPVRRDPISRDEFAAQLQNARKRRESDAVGSVSAQLAQVFAAMAAGLAQLATSISTGSEESNT